MMPLVRHQVRYHHRPLLGGCWFGCRVPPVRAGIRPTWTQRTWKSTTAQSGEKSGHISTSAHESILFFDNIFPLKLSNLLRRQWQTDRDLQELLQRFDSSSLGVMDPIRLVKRAIPDKVPMKVTEIIPRLKDGGAFVKFSHSPGITPSEIEGTLSKMLDKHPVKPWFNPFRGIKASLVNGVPWLEDLHRLPKSRVKVEFVPQEAGGAAEELPQETLYSLFRKYGKIAEITAQPSDSKVVPKFAYLDFVLVRDAIMARNCMHGYSVLEALGGGKHGTKLRLSYEQKVKAHRIWDWVTNHPRIIFPIVAALLAAITVTVFDPIREFFIKAHVQRSYKLSNSWLYKWLKRQTEDIKLFGKEKSDEAGLRSVWSHRRDLIDTVRKWLLETADTFIVVQGPRGSGKKEIIVDQALKGRKNVLVVDCKPVVEARGESGTIRRLAAQVGYRPIFSWANSISSMVDLAVQSTTGVKSGFSETLDSQLAKILHTAASALKDVSVAERKRDGKDSSLSDDAYLEAHPERRAVVVIDNFLHKNEESSLVYDKVAEWAAMLVQSNVAHVVFLTKDTSYSKSLSRALPDRLFKQVSLGDLSPEVAKNYVMSHLEETTMPEEHGEEKKHKARQSEEQKAESKEAHDRERTRNLAELDTCIETLGGRLTDLEFLARRLKSGQSPRQAVDEMVEQSASEIIKMFLLMQTQQKSSSSSSSSEERHWSAEQAWYLVKELATKESLRYNEVLLTDAFSSSRTPGADNGEAAIEALSNAELVTVKSHKGRPQSIRAGKPVYQAAFGLLTRDAVLKARMDLDLLKEQLAVETKSIEKVEQELSLLVSLSQDQTWPTRPRIRYLGDKLSSSQSKVDLLDKEIGQLKKVLQKEA